MTLARTKPQTSTELLDEDPAAVRDTREAYNIHVGDVDALIKNIDSGENRNFAITKTHQSELAFPPL